MKVLKTKYAVEFTEEEKKAILKVMELSDTLCDENICDNKECEKCPLYNGFCISGGTDDSRINSLRQKIEKFLNGTD